MIYPEDFEIIVDFLSRIPGISERAAERAVLQIGRLDEAERLRIVNAFKKVGSVNPCSVCGFPAHGDLCAICADSSRDKETVCVVEQPRDVVSIEKLGEYKGVYHILGGVISPLEDVGPEDINIDALFKRVRKGVRRVIIAINPTIEGEATAKYIVDSLSKYDVEIFKIACGIPYGGTIDMSDELTLRKAFEDLKPVVFGGVYDRD